MKSKGSVKYYPENEVLYVLIEAGEEAKSVEIEPGITAELSKSGKLIGIEILDASKYLRKLIQQRLEPQLRQRIASQEGSHFVIVGTGARSARCT